jgi:hypothetical protein
VECKIYFDENCILRICVFMKLYVIKDNIMRNIGIIICYDHDYDYDYVLKPRSRWEVILQWILKKVGGSELDYLVQNNV